MIAPTAAEIEAARTPAGGWTKDQLAQWGVSWPPPKGWKKALVAQDIRLMPALCLIPRRWWKARMAVRRSEHTSSCIYGEG